MKKAAAEGWLKLRKEADSKSIALAQQKIANKAADNATLAADIKHRLLLRLKRTEELFPLDATEVRQVKDGKTLVFRLRDLTNAYKDLVQDEQAQNSEPVQVIIDV